MRWSLLLAVFGLSITDVASFAQRPPGDQRLATTRPSSQDAGFFTRSGVVRFQFLQGRLCLDPPRHRKGSQNSDSDGVYESITVTADRGIPSLHYVCQTSEQHITLSVQNANNVRIESWFPKEAERSILEQPATGEVTWTTTRGDLVDRTEGATILHARMTDQSTFGKHFGCLVERLLRGQTLEKLTNATQVAMLRLAMNAETPSVEEIESAIEQLRSPSRSTRMIADRRLVSWGTPIVPLLRQSLEGDLDAEQRDRLKAILRRLRPYEDDTPATLAMLFINDEVYWNQIAFNLDATQIQVANNHLVQYGASPINLDQAPDQRIAARPSE